MEDFLPWINEEDARKKGLSTEAYAHKQAALWKKGLADWGQDLDLAGFINAVQTPPVAKVGVFDLDYKGLSNTGTWFIGRLQTERKG